MKKINVLYWVFTGLLIPLLGFGSVMGIMADPDSAKIITSLGYPAYLDQFLGITRLLALCVILLPKLPRLKEWAYAGLTFDIVGAIFSIVASGQPITHIIFPCIALLIVLCSYVLYHKKAIV